MADSIVRLKVESSEYDSKIKRASQGLLHMEEACRKVNGTLAILEKDEKSFVESLGKMETTSKTVRGSIGELTTAFTDLRAQYNRLTAEEKQGDYGKALSKSLDDLKERIKAGKTELKDIDGELGKNGNLLDNLSSKLGINVKKFVGWGAALAAGKVALNTLKDAFFASEANLDNWHSTVYQCESLWDAFLTNLNTGDISGYLSNIDRITAAARDAYAELDRLGTQKAINNPKIKAQEVENERFRNMLRTGRYIAPNDGRKASMREGQLLTPEQLKVLASQLQNGMTTLNSYIKSEVNQTTKAIDALYTQQALQLGMSPKEFRAGTADMTTFDTRMAGYQKYRDWETRKQSVMAMASSGMNVSDSAAKYLREANPYQQYAAWGVFKDDGELFNKINELINQRAALQSQNYSNIGRSYRSINKAEGITVGPKGGKTKSGTSVNKDVYIPVDGSIDAQRQWIDMLQQAYGAAIDQGIRNELKVQIDYANKALDEMQGKLVPVEGSIDSQTQKVRELTKAFNAAGEQGVRDSLKVQLDAANKVLNEMQGKTAWMNGESWGYNEKGMSSLSASLRSQLATTDYGTPLYTSVSANLSDAESLSKIIKAAVENGIELASLGIDGESLWEKIFEGVDVPDDIWIALKEKLLSKGIVIDKAAKDGDKVANAWKGASSAFGAAANALSTLSQAEGEAANAAKAMTIGAAIAQLVAQFTAIPKGVEIWSWIAGTIAGTATLITAISQIKGAAGSYSQGGIVPGTSYSGDNMLANVNSGEVILNRAQQGNLASQLNQSYSRTASSQPFLQSEMIYLGVNNALSRMGKGELVTTQMLRNYK